MSGFRFSSVFRFCKQLPPFIHQNCFSSPSSPNTCTCSIQISSRSLSYYGFDKSSYGISSIFTPYYLSFRSCSSGVISVDEALKLEQKGVVNGEDLTCEARRVLKFFEDDARGDCNLEKALDEASILLSTELVAEILQRLQDEEEKAFRFFMWAEIQENYRHEPQLFNEMIEILSNEHIKINQYRIVCDLLYCMKWNATKSVPVGALVKILRQYTKKYSKHLAKCSNSTRVKVRKQPEIFAFNMLLAAFCKCCVVEQAEALFRRVMGTVKPIAETYSELFFGWCRIGNPERGMKLVDEMISMGFRPNSLVYNTAVETYSRLGMMDEAFKLLNFMKKGRSKDYSLTANTYTSVILALVKADRIDESFKVLGEMLSTGCIPNVATYKVLIDGMCSAGKIDEAYRVLDEMGKGGYPPDIVSYNCFLKVLCDNKKKDEAFKLYERMIEVGVEPSVHTYNMLMEMFFALDQPELASQAWNEMDTRRCQVDINTYYTMIHGLLRCGKVDEAYVVLDEVVDRGVRLHYEMFDVIVQQLSELGNIHEIHRLSQHMKRFPHPAMSRCIVNQKRRSMTSRAKIIY